MCVCVDVPHFPSVLYVRVFFGLECQSPEGRSSHAGPRVPRILASSQPPRALMEDRDGVPGIQPPESLVGSFAEVLFGTAPPSRRNIPMHWFPTSQMLLLRLHFAQSGPNPSKEGSLQHNRRLSALVWLFLVGSASQGAIGIDCYGWDSQGPGALADHACC